MCSYLGITTFSAGSICKFNNLKTIITTIINQPMIFYAEDSHWWPSGALASSAAPGSERRLEGAKISAHLRPDSAKPRATPAPSGSEVNSLSTASFD
jgi:hypothetical protein